MNIGSSPILDRVRIRFTGSYLPARVMTNQDIVDSGVATSSEWVAQTLGIQERRIASPCEETSDLACRAGLDALSSAGMDRNDVDMLILATATPDRRAPSTACITQAKMEITNNCPAFDVSAVCSGFVYALTIAGQFIQSGSAKRILVIGADTFSRITDWKDRNSVFFGDAAGAAIVEASDCCGFFAGTIQANGAGMDVFTVYPGDETFSMDGRGVYEAATTILPKAIADTLQRHGKTVDDLKMIIPHQASLRVLKTTAEKLGLPLKRMQIGLPHFANTAAASIPLQLDHVNKQRLLTQGDLILLAAIGSGWTWGTILYTWQ